ncbi:MAG: PepSY domain-containing protein [Firmicutes bacterium]|nr:PepSY domain-containing protein [Bacillota bacterium]
MKRIIRQVTAFSLMLALALSIGVVPASAASKGAPRVEEVEYNGNGIVEVEFVGDVKYKRVKVTVRDNKGKKYKTRIISRDEDDIKFRIKKYKAGRTYTIRIKGVKRWNAGKYGTVKTRVKVYRNSSFIGEERAKQIALSDAGFTESQVWFTKLRRDYDDGLYIYEVEFVKDRLEYEYEIHAVNGKILKKKIDWD